MSDRCGVTFHMIVAFYYLLRYNWRGGGVMFCSNDIRNVVSVFSAFVCEVKSVIYLFESDIRLTKSRCMDHFKGATT
jgi:hypothetical protein